MRTSVMGIVRVRAGSPANGGKQAQERRAAARGRGRGRGVRDAERNTARKGGERT